MPRLGARTRSVLDPPRLSVEGATPPSLWAGRPHCPWISDRRANCSLKAARGSGVRGRLYLVCRRDGQGGEEAGADLVLIETMNDPYELKAAVLAAKENTSLPVVATMIFDTRAACSRAAASPPPWALLEGLRVDALGVNCGMGPEQMKGLLSELLACSSPAGGDESQCRPAPLCGRLYRVRHGS